MRKKKSVAKRILHGLEEFVKVLESGDKITDHFRVITIEKVNSLEFVQTVRGPKNNSGT